METKPKSPPASGEGDVTPIALTREGGHVLEMQRRRLLLAMREVAGENGLAGATVGAVCKRSRVSRRTFYDLFEDRDDCFLAAFEQALEEVGERVIPAFKGYGRTQRAQSWRARIRASVEALLATFDEQPQLARLCVVETPKGGPAVLARQREVLDALAAAVDEGRVEARAGAGPPALTAEATVGGALAVIHARLLSDSGPLVELVPALTGMIVFPYLGAGASRKEAERPYKAAPPKGKPVSNGNGAEPPAGDPFRDLRLRFTYRTARVLATIAAHPGASNRQIGEEAGVSDQGQISKLLKRLERAGLLENDGGGRDSGAPNMWRLTARGQAIDSALGASREPQHDPEVLDPSLAGGARG